MEIIKKRGRPGRSSPIPDDAGEIQDAHSDSIRDREAGESGDSAQDAFPEDARTNWFVMADWLRTLPCNRELRYIWHPAPKNAFYMLMSGRTAKVMVGLPGYELMTGERVAL